MLPTFIGAGTQRGGTTWLYNCLKEHPQVCMPDTKEIRFFNRNWEKGVAWYESFFQNCQRYVALGEFTPNYLQDPEAIQRMAQLVPDARIIVSLRHPVDRAMSAYTLWRAHGQYENTSFQQAFEKGGNIKKIGFYAEQLRALYRCYPQNQVLVILFDDIQNDPSKVLQRVFHFLSIDSTFLPSGLKTQYNKIIFPKTQALCEKFGMQAAVEYIKKTSLGDAIRAMMANSNKQKKQIQIHNRHYYESVYKKDIQDLEQIINRDLSHWYKGA